MCVSFLLQTFCSACVCVCACVRACVRACERACVQARVGACVCVLTIGQVLETPCSSYEFRKHEFVSMGSKGLVTKE